MMEKTTPRTTKTTTRTYCYCWRKKLCQHFNTIFFDQFCSDFLHLISTRGYQDRLPGFWKVFSLHFPRFFEVQDGKPTRKKIRKIQKISEHSYFYYILLPFLLANWVSHTSVFWAQNKGSFGQIFGTPVTRVFGTPKIQFCRFYWDENTAFYYFLASDRRASACRERKYLMYITIFYYFLLFWTLVFWNYVKPCLGIL